MDYKKLDKVFSEYIRRRDAIEGYVICCTCNQMFPWKKVDAGHFVKRGNMSVRWDEFNAHAQCVRCNRDLDGNMDEYEKFMQLKYGAETVALIKSNGRKTVHRAQFEIDELVKIYQDKIKEL